MAKILITGVGGFIGRNLSDYMGQRGHIVYGAPHHDLDVRSVDRVETVMERIKPDWVFHCAALGGVKDSRESAALAAVNVQGTVNVVNAAAHNGVKILVHAGSLSEVREEPSIYAWSKRAATDYVKLFGYDTLRLGTVYGPGEADYRFVTSVLKGMLSGQAPRLTNPFARRDFVYIDDVCLAFELIAQRIWPGHYGAAYNIGPARSMTLQDAAEEIKRLTHYPKVLGWHGDLECQRDTHVNCDYFRMWHKDWKPRSFTHGVLDYIYRINQANEVMR